jgi:hypothetical protein
VFADVMSCPRFDCERAAVCGNQRKRMWTKLLSFFKFENKNKGPTNYMSIVVCLALLLQDVVFVSLESVAVASLVCSANDYIIDTNTFSLLNNNNNNNEKWSVSTKPRSLLDTVCYLRFGCSFTFLFLKKKKHFKKKYEWNNRRSKTRSFL